MTNESDLLTRAGNELITAGGALIALVDTFRAFDGEMAGFTCREADNIAHALATLGGTRGEEAGDNVLLRHGVFDDEIDDEHHDIFHEQRGDDACPYQDTCPLLNPEPDGYDDEIERRKEDR